MAKIIVIDDDASVLAVVKFALSRAGHEVQATDSPISAIALIHQSQLDLIMVDYKMPELSGVELLQRLRFPANGQPTTTPALLMSGAPTPQLLEAIQNLPKVEFIEKPFIGKELIHKIEEVLALYAKPS